MLLFAYGGYCEAQDQASTTLPINIGIEGLLRQFQSNFRTTSVDPDEYVVAPGDKFTIYFTSNQIDDINCEIRSGGDLFVKSVGLIELGHITLREAISKISARVRAIYPKTDFTVQLTGFRIVRINVTGEVQNPGIYYAPAIWRVSEIIDMAGGLTAEAQTRDIQLRGLGREVMADLVRFNALGEQWNNPLICNGNIVEIPHQRSVRGYVTVSGLVNRPESFAYRENDNLGDLIAFAGGLKGELADMVIVISSARGAEKAPLDGESKDIENWRPAAGDNLKFVWKKDRQAFGTVAIFGAVTRPGRYVIPQERFTVADLYEMTGGPSEDSNADMVQIYRLNMTSLAGGSYSTAGVSNPGIDADDFNALATNPPRQRISLNPRQPVEAADLFLRDGDSLYIPYATGMISVQGAVVSPGMVKFEPKQSIMYYIEEAGGYGFDADKDHTVVINPYTGGQISANQTGHLFDGEVVFVPRKEKLK